MTNNIRSTFNCHNFLESSGQVHQTIYRVNIWGSLYPNIGLIWCRVKKLIFSIKRLICLTLVSRFCFIKRQSYIIKTPCHKVNSWSKSCTKSKQGLTYLKSRLVKTKLQCNSLLILFCVLLSNFKETFVKCVIIQSSVYYRLCIELWFQFKHSLVT